MTKESVYLDWLRDAHAMEKHAESLLKAAASRLTDHPALQARIEQYLEQSRDQQQQVKTLLRQYDSNWSVLKESLGRMSVVGQAASDMLQDEEGIRVAVSSYVFCNYKIATYSTLLVAAEQAEEGEDVRIVRRILQQESQMASWLLQLLPQAAEEAIVLRTEPELSGTD
ncbi:DUF892 family protein [Pantoea dispersa]|uniref:DUF892 family protein n=2 Tax=Pantoea dispersa TaxID=59814 RepID=UPI00241CC5D4|nr:DUF892 family protein [Pantoea dispersa]